MRQTEQEAFWETSFGDEYTTRNQGDKLLAGNLALFAKILPRTDRVTSVLELGANQGLNLKALHQLLPGADFSAVEINASAVALLKQWGKTQVHHGSILEYEPVSTFDLVLIKGVLIHINPEFLQQVYRLMHKASRRYILLVEYYNPTPVEMPYRGHANRLYKRDFAGEMLDACPNLRLVDYGFTYRRDVNFGQDDATWFLLEKVSPRA